MAGGEWVRARVRLDSDPKVIAIAAALGRDPRFRTWSVTVTGTVTGQERDCPRDCHVTPAVTVYVTVAGLVKVWGALRDQGEQEGDDLVVKELEIDSIDILAGVPSFGRAMASVGWVTPHPDGGICLPKFFAQNGSKASARKRSTQSWPFHGRKPVSRRRRS